MSKPNDSHIDIRQEGGASFVGPDATNLYRAITLASALRLFAKTGIIPTRGVTSTVMLRIAKEYTGKTYKRGQHALAAADVQIWIDTMRSAIPTTLDGKPI